MNIPDSLVFFLTLVAFGWIAFQVGYDRGREEAEDEA